MKKNINTIEIILLAFIIEFVFRGFWEKYFLLVGCIVAAFICLPEYKRAKEGKVSEVSKQFYLNQYNLKNEDLEIFIINYKIFQAILITFTFILFIIKTIIGLTLIIEIICLLTIYSSDKIFLYILKKKHTIDSNK